MAAPITAKSKSCSRVGADGGADVEDDALAAERRPERGDRRAIDLGRRRRQNFAIAISAPVLPAETAKSASPFFTASIERHMLERQRPRRSAWLGLSSMRTEISVCSKIEAALTRG